MRLGFFTRCSSIRFYRKSKVIQMRFLFLVFILYGALSVWAQVHTFLNVQAENDYINWWGKGTDRFYTGGNFLSVDWIRSHKEIRLLGLELVQKTYTPSDLQTTQVEAMDHPYAGLLFMRHLIMVSPAQCKWNMLARISYGISGPRSGVARFQKRLHQWIGDEVPQGWATMQPSYPFRQVDLSFNFPLQLSNRFSLGLFQLAEGGTFFNRWIGQGWLFWGDQPIPFFPWNRWVSAPACRTVGWQKKDLHWFICFSGSAVSSSRSNY